MFLFKSRKKSSEFVQIFLTNLQEETELNYNKIVNSINTKHPNLISPNDEGLMNLVYARIAIQNQTLYNCFNKKEFENIHLWVLCFLESNKGEFAVNKVKNYFGIFLNASKLVKVAGPIAVADSLLKDWIGNEGYSTKQSEFVESINFPELINITREGMMNFKTNWEELKNKYNLDYDSLY